MSNVRVLYVTVLSALASRISVFRVAPILSLPPNRSLSAEQVNTAKTPGENSKHNHHRGIYYRGYYYSPAGHLVSQGFEVTV